MRGSPVSVWTQAGRAFWTALLPSICVFLYIYVTHAMMYEKLYRNDGQNGLGAFVDACRPTGYTLVGTFVVVFFAQRLILTNPFADSHAQAPPPSGAILREWMADDLTVPALAAHLEVSRVTLSKS